MTGAGAPEGNNNAMKWSTPEERRAACDRLCAHLRSGLSMKCFPDADDQTLKRYMRDFPIDFAPDKIRQAIRENHKFWEVLGINGALGKIKNFSAPTWKFNMQNRCGWKDNLQLGSDPENPLPDNAPVVIEIVRTEKAKSDAPSDS